MDNEKVIRKNYASFIILIVLLVISVILILVTPYYRLTTTFSNNGEDDIFEFIDRAHYRNAGVFIFQGVADYDNIGIDSYSGWDCLLFRQLKDFDTEFFSVGYLISILLYLEILSILVIIIFLFLKIKKKIINAIFLITTIINIILFIGGIIIILVSNDLTSYSSYYTSFYIFPFITCLASFILYKLSDSDRTSFINENSVKNGKGINIELLVLLNIITFSIYSFFWVYSIMNRINELKNDNKPVGLQLLCYIIVPFYSIYWYYKYSSELIRIMEKEGFKTDNFSGLLAFISLIIRMPSMLILQYKLNEFTVFQDKCNKETAEKVQVA